MPRLKISNISLETFNSTLSRYPATVPAALQELDTLRYDTIPGKVAKFEKDAYLTRAQVEKLVEWKLKHGTFRPKLLQLVQSNPAETVEQTTKKAFSSIPELDLDQKDADPTPSSALKTLIALKGIGPATASLLLSVMAPEAIPFFSDELFRWCMWDEKDSSGKGGGWKRGIKYNVKEYEALCGVVWEVRKRLAVRAVDVERVAWVLGKEGVDVSEEGIEDENEKGDEVKVEEEVEAEVVKKDGVGEKKVKKGTKRKEVESKPVAQGTRKSARVKK